MAKKLFSVKEIVLVALFAAAIAVSAWIAIPAAIPFTMQTFAVFFTAALLGTKCGIAAVSVYVLLGGVGLPVFSGFTGGAAVLLSVNGGYIIGLIGAAAVCGLIASGSKSLLRVSFSMLAGLLVCYIFGSAWFAFINKASFFSAFSTCVLPFVFFDILKILLAATLSVKMRKFVCLK